MNIRPITECNIQAFQGKKNKSKSQKRDNNILPKALILAGALSAATISGILLIKNPNFSKSLPKHTKNLKETLQSKYKELQVQSTAGSIKKPNTSLNIEVLPSGIQKVEEVTSDIIQGTNILTKLNPSVNGISKIQTHKFVNGDISEITTFDEAGKQLKNIIFYHDYMIGRKPHTITVSDSSKGITKIFYEFLKTNPEKISSVLIENPDGTIQKTTIAKDKLSDKLSRAFLEIKKSIF